MGATCTIVQRRVQRCVHCGALGGAHCRLCERSAIRANACSADDLSIEAVVCKPSTRVHLVDCLQHAREGLRVQDACGLLHSEHGRRLDGGISVIEIGVHVCVIEHGQATSAS
jgi:hypothetical protein